MSFKISKIDYNILRKKGDKLTMQYTIRTNEKFYNQFQQLQNKLNELSNIFQNPNTKISDLELNKWNDKATKLQKDLSRLILECGFRFDMKLD